MNRIRSNYYAVLLIRILILYVVFMLCRVVFAVYNWDIIGPMPWSELPSVIKGSLIFDSASILYVNLLFIFLTLIPFRFREKAGYQRILLWLYLITNGAALLINVADIYYFPFKLSRIASDDLHFLGEGNFGTLMGSFLKDFWSGGVVWLACMALLWFGFRWTRYKPKRNRARLKPVFFFISQLLLIGLAAGYSIFAIRGFSLSKASFPITMSDASLYVKPQYASLVLSNPFCLIRTIGHKVSAPKYFPEAELDALYPVKHEALDSVKVRIEGRPNIVVFALESFGSAHLKSFSDRFEEGGVSYTPFLDSLASQSYVFTNAYQNGLRSIDAMPAIWASIPSFKTQFLSMPNSVASYKAMPSCLADMGYETMFLHGAVRESMSFVSFGQMAGIQQFYSREDYEAEHGGGDFDGKWGIWDHKFLPFAQEKINKAKEPFFATVFTLSSHHPYRVPPGFEDKFPEGKVPIQKAIAYADYSLRKFFEAAAKEKWFANTLFVLTADHGAGSDNEKYKQMPYSYAVPILFYYPGNDLKADAAGLKHGDTGELSAGIMRGRHIATAQHVDLMPTILRMVGYGEPFFAFGRDVFNEPDADFAINYYGSAFNFMTDSTRYVFNEREVVGVYRYREDFMSIDNITQLQPVDSANIKRMKAFIQQYYKHVRDRDYVP